MSFLTETLLHICTRRKGIVTGIEIEIREDTGYKMTRDRLRLVEGKVDNEELRSFLFDQFTKFDGVEFFYYVSSETLSVNHCRYTSYSHARIYRSLPRSLLL